MCADRGKLRSPQRRANAGHRHTQQTRGSSRPDDRPHDNALASVVNICTGKDGGWSPSDLYAKLHNFEKDHPRLCARLQAKLKELHEFCSRTPAAPIHLTPSPISRLVPLFLRRTCSYLVITVELTATMCPLPTRGCAASGDRGQLCGTTSEGIGMEHGT